MEAHVIHGSPYTASTTPAVWLFSPRSQLIIVSVTCMLTGIRVIQLFSTLDPSLIHIPEGHHDRAASQSERPSSTPRVHQPPSQFYLVSAPSQLQALHPHDTVLFTSDPTVVPDVQLGSPTNDTLFARLSAGPSPTLLPLMTSPAHYSMTSINPGGSGDSSSWASGLDNMSLGGAHTEQQTNGTLPLPDVFSPSGTYRESPLHTLSAGLTLPYSGRLNIHVYTAFSQLRGIPPAATGGHSSSRSNRATGKKRLCVFRRLVGGRDGPISHHHSR